MTTGTRRDSLRPGLRSYRRMLAYARPFPLQLVLAAVSLVLMSLLGLAMPWAAKELVDSVVAPQDLLQLNRIALILAGILLRRLFFSFAQSYLLAWVGEYRAAQASSSRAAGQWYRGPGGQGDRAEAVGEGRANMGHSLPSGFVCNRNSVGVVAPRCRLLASVLAPKQAHAPTSSS